MQHSVSERRAAAFFILAGRAAGKERLPQNAKTKRKVRKVDKVDKVGKAVGKTAGKNTEKSKKTIDNPFFSLYNEAVCGGPKNEAVKAVPNGSERGLRNAAAMLRTAALRTKSIDVKYGGTGS